MPPALRLRASDGPAVLAAQVARGRAVGGGPLSLPEAVLQQRWEAQPVRGAVRRDGEAQDRGAWGAGRPHSPRIAAGALSRPAQWGRGPRFSGGAAAHGRGPHPAWRRGSPPPPLGLVAARAPSGSRLPASAAPCCGAGGVRAQSRSRRDARSRTALHLCAARGWRVAGGWPFWPWGREPAGSGAALRRAGQADRRAAGGRAASRLGPGPPDGKEESGRAPACPRIWRAGPRAGGLPLLLDDWLLPGAWRCGPRIGWRTGCGRRRSCCIAMPTRNRKMDWRRTWVHWLRSPSRRRWRRCGSRPGWARNGLCRSWWMWPFRWHWRKRKPCRPP